MVACTSLVVTMADTKTVLYARTENFKERADEPVIIEISVVYVQATI